MKFLYLISALSLLLSSSAVAQPYVKFEEQPPMEITIKERFIKNIKIKYNTPSNGVLYLTLLKDGEGIGNSKHKVTRGKRILNCNITIWDDKEITKKGDYTYKLLILPKDNSWKNPIAKAKPITGVKAIKQKK